MRVLNAGLAVVFAVVLAFWADRIGGSWGGGYWAFDLVAGWLVCAAAVSREHRLWEHRLWEHRLWARAAAWLGGGVGRLRGQGVAAVAGCLVAVAAVVVSRLAELPSEPGPAMALALGVLVASAVRTLPAAQARVVAVAGLVVVLATLLPYGTAAPSLPAPATTLAAATWTCALAAGLTPRVLAARRRAAAGRVRAEVRRQVARELHDVVAHHVTGIVLQSQAARVLARKRPEHLEGTLAGIEASGAEAMAATRRLVGLLRNLGDGHRGQGLPGEGLPGEGFSGEGLLGEGPRGEGVPGQGLSAVLTVEELKALAARLPGPEVRWDLPEAPDWPPEVAATVYRTVQESLTNIARHAPRARLVTVGVRRTRDTLTVEVTDDGPPARRRPGHRSGYGLIGMRERLHALGGHLHAAPREGRGWAVRATLPLRATP
ncbi:sensor histidine kinase [Nonomuraea typhae]|uniref:sensor histidine kinase n=1 Tax=Nonomuraea typhae TaxID=2603600 RepID=UPI0012F93D9D|nr:histidine kinase [Nonomuraea typhae]